MKNKQPPTRAITHSLRLPIFANFLINQKRSALLERVIAQPLAVRQLMIKSKLKISHILVNLFLIVCSFGLSYLLISLLRDLALGNVGLQWIPLAVFFIIMLIASVLSVDNIKYLVINLKDHTLSWYSVLNPIGSKINLDEYIGYISTNVYSANGVTQRLFLVDRNRKTGLCIDQLVYSNFEEIKNCLKMKQIKFKMGGPLNYVRLHFMNGIKV